MKVRADDNASRRRVGQMLSTGACEPVRALFAHIVVTWTVRIEYRLNIWARHDWPYRPPRSTRYYQVGRYRVRHPHGSQRTSGRISLFPQHPN